MKRVEFYFDYSSPFAYLGSERIEALTERAGAELVWKPMLLGAVFKQIGTSNIPLLDASAQKRQYLVRDMARWADHFGIELSWPKRFPMHTIMALRLTLLLDDPVPFIHRTFRAYWRDGRDIDDPTVMHELLEELDRPGDLIFKTREPAVKEMLKNATSEALDKGVFGAPTCIVTTESASQLFWGQDRLNFVLKALEEDWSVT